jgi:2-polyprenyl-3-methyl-5-hydroxy-6-metoxy-1,4-benzoquinol methylase
MAEAEYIFDPAWEQERERIGSGELLFDPFTQQVLETIGIDDGWRCLEIGAGGGTVAGWMCEQVAPSGEVVAIDLDTRFVERLSHPNLEVRQHDITTGPVDDRPFDLVHARLVLEHIPTRDVVLPQLVDMLNPGGWLVVEDMDATDAEYLPAEKYFEYPLTDVHGPGKITKGMNALLRPLDVIDVDYGHRLPGELVRAGLEDVDARRQTQLVRGGTDRAKFTLLMMEFLKEQLIATGEVTEEDYDFVVGKHHDPTHFWMSTPMVSAWGRKPL